MGDPSTATRIVYWHIAPVWPMYVLAAISLCVFGYGVWHRARLWRIGAATPPLGHVRLRLHKLWTQVFRHERFFREGVAGTMHAAIALAMLLLFCGTLVVMMHEDFGLPVMRGWFYLVFQKLVLNIAGAALALACVVALARRYVRRVPRLQSTRPGAPPDRSHALALAFLLALMLEGFALQAIRIAATADPFASWAPVGNALSLAFAGAAPSTLVTFYQFTWWVHLVTALAFIAWLPYGKLLHVLTGPANVYAGNVEPTPRVAPPIDFESADHLGISRLAHFTWKDLLDLDACTSCGRCEAACPAHAAGAPLSPRNLVLDLRDHLHAHGPALLRDAEAAVPALVGGAIREDTLWACTTCSACVQECPVHIEHVPKIAGMRRHLVMEETRLPSTLQDALKSLEDRMHPYKGSTGDRTEWHRGLHVLPATELESCDVLYWVGCTASFDPRSQKVARSFVELMHRAGLKVAVLGRDEPCCGDPARRAGHEFLYDQIARSNVELLQSVKPKRIVTTCPHCRNALGTEYAAFGGSFEVLHHTQLIDELVCEGRLRPEPAEAGSVTYHDPCYLGRYGGEYDAPRRMLDAAGAQRVEMERSRSKSFCCGGGGGQAFMASAPEGGSRINVIRVKEARATGAATLAVGCPFCMRMLEDGAKATGEGGLEVRDVAEVVLDAVLRGDAARESEAQR